MRKGKQFTVPKVTISVSKDKYLAKTAEFAKFANSWQHEVTRRSLAQILRNETPLCNYQIQDVVESLDLYEQVVLAREVVAEEYLSDLVEAFSDSERPTIAARILIESSLIRVDEDQNVLVTIIFPNEARAWEFKNIVRKRRLNHFIANPL
ncbi:hypothetical protein J5277_17985 [Rhizobium sp. 16-449-1b]|uniref:hypothetical protein n=1 Tax=Rhizobium sp. 16-449-1b TaxID=2819989 RepID=UPI001ADD3EB9|nr:hypothetical protein [Rhizobium sp. 16-449-1b]MBO9195995.1 hypothetical protein [Rhizobium sp. 16-449-1b]